MLFGKGLAAPSFPKPKLKPIPVGRLQLPRGTPSKTFSWGLNFKQRWRQQPHSPAFPALPHRPPRSIGLKSRFSVLLTEEQLSASSTKIWSDRFFGYSFCFTSLICLEVKEKGRGYNFLTKLEKAPKKDPRDPKDPLLGTVISRD